MTSRDHALDRTDPSAIQLVIDRARRKGTFEVRDRSYVPRPGCPESFCLALGFRHTGRVDDDEVVLEFPLRRDAA
jgi:diamine N-acetyltransferase